MSAGKGHLVELERVRKSFGDNVVLDGIDLTIDRGEVVVIAGPSGSGKSTMLRCINGLEGIDEGDVRFEGRSLAKAGRDVNRMRAEIGMVFQQFNLFAHKSVMQNLSWRRSRSRDSRRRRRATRPIACSSGSGLTEKADAYPADLSGGQQQRVAIARALAMEPKLMLFDEPTSALDPEMIREVLDVMRDLARDGMTMAVVTHEMGFAREVGDRIVFIDDGRIVEQAPPAEFFADAQSERARDFVDKIIHH